MRICTHLIGCQIDIILNFNTYGLKTVHDTKSILPTYRYCLELRENLIILMRALLFFLCYNFSLWCINSCLIKSLFCCGRTITIIPLLSICYTSNDRMDWTPSDLARLTVPLRSIKHIHNDLRLDISKFIENNFCPIKNTDKPTQRKRMNDTFLKLRLFYWP